jgi:UDP-N-acetylglucosamine 3-dehydrogenase
MNMRVGVIGFGVMGQNHARVLRSVSGVELVGIFDISTKVQTSEYNFVSSVESLINLNLDYCVISVPTALHLPFCRIMAENRIPCLIEKPLAINSIDAEQIEFHFKSNSTFAAVGYVERFNPVLMKARDLLKKDVIGELLQISTLRHSPRPKRILDIGVVFDLATHDLDLTQWLGNAKFDSITCLRKSLDDGAFEDMVNVIGRLENNTLTNHSINWIYPYKERKSVIIGKNGILLCDTLKQRLIKYKSSEFKSPSIMDNLSNLNETYTGTIIEFDILKKEPLYLEHKSFISAIRGNKSSIVTLNEGVQNIKILEKLLN